MNEIELMRQIQMKASELGHRLFRNNVAMGWAGQQVRVSRPQMVMVMPGDVVIRSARALHAGLCPGSPDLVGLTNAGQFIGCEIKAPKGRPTPGQESFIDMVKRLGGVGIIARSVDDFHV